MEKSKLVEYGREISKNQFDAYCYCRQAGLQFYAQEREWYSFFDNKLLAVILLDFADNDYGFIIFGRGENRLFHTIEVKFSFISLDSARAALYEKMKDYELTVQHCYPLGITNKRINLFEDIIPKNKQHKCFKMLSHDAKYEAARNIITEIANSFIDKDGHFEKEFQSNNFYARLWELYLHMYFNHNLNLQVLNEHHSPDFEISYFGKNLFVEATTVNPSQSEERPDPPLSLNPKTIKRNLKNFMPIKFGSVLSSKLKKKYWEYDHVKNNPLIFAIHDYHSDISMTWSSSAILVYLYGVDVKLKNGKPVVADIKKHKWKGKEIESGFFYLKCSEYVSGVLFSNQATLTKFNRMGRLAGLGSNFVKMRRVFFLLNPEPNAVQPIIEIKSLDDPDYEETWSEGLVMYHNPNALYPLSLEAFDDIVQVLYDERDGLIQISHQPYPIIDSMTICYK